MPDINVTYGAYRETNRHRVVGLQREPIGPKKHAGPKPGQPSWVHGHIPGQGTWSFIPPQLCGKTRDSILSEKRDTRKPKPMTAIGGCNGGRKRRGGGKGKRARAIAKSLQAQDKAVAKYKKRVRLNRDQQITVWAKTMQAVNAGRLADAINNGGMEVCNG